MRFRRSPDESLELNLTPMIDCLMFLVVVLLLSTSFRQTEHLRLRLPTAQGQPEQPAARPVMRITVDAQSRYQVNGKPVNLTTATALRDYLISEANGQRPTVRVDADGQASHQAVITVLDAAGQAGLSTLDIGTESSRQS